MSIVKPDKIIIELDELGTTLTEVRGESKTAKTINPDDLRFLFSDVAFETGLMPCSDTGVVFFGRRGDVEAVLYQSGPRVQSVRFGGPGGDVVDNVPFPHLIFAFQLNIAPRTEARGVQNRLRSMKLFALNGGISSLTDNVYPFTKYGNVYNNGGICWGRNNIVVTDVTSMRGVVNAFYSTPFNRHLGGSRRLVEEYAESGEYDLGSPLGKTVDGLIKETFSGQRY